MIGHSELVKCARSAIFVGKKGPAGMWLTLPGPQAAHCLVTRQHIVWLQDSTLSGSKTAHCLVPRQHIVWFRESTLSGFKQAHCLVPSQHVVWFQYTQTCIFHKIWHERVRHGSPRADIKSGRSYTLQDDFYMGFGPIFRNIR